MAGDAVARERLAALRQTIARIEGRAPEHFQEKQAPVAHPDTAGAQAGSGFRGGDGARLLPLGVAALDEALQGGLPLDAMVELRGEEMRDAGAVSGFALSLCARLTQEAGEAGRRFFFWIGERMVALDTGLPHLPGLADHGFSHARLLYAAPKKIEEALWLAEQALASRAFAAVLMEVRGNPARFGLTESRRLSLKAREAGLPLFVLRQAGAEEAGSAVFRLRVRPAPASQRRLGSGSPLSGSLGFPVFHLAVEKSRLPVHAEFFLEWNPHDRRFRTVSPVPVSRRAPENPVAAFSASADRPDRAREMGHVLAFNGAFNRAS